jgi:hypothetical protein
MVDGGQNLEALRKVDAMGHQLASAGKQLDESDRCDPPPVVDPRGQGLQRRRSSHASPSALVYEYTHTQKKCKEVSTLKPSGVFQRLADSSPC